MVTLAIDAGTSALKLLRHDPETGVPTLDRIPHDGIDLDAWLAALARNIRDNGDGERIDRIAITGQMHGLVTSEGDAWGEPITWTDQRGASILPGLVARIDADAMVRLGGPLASGFLGVSLAWIARHDPARFRRIDRVFLPKDALVSALTGEHVTDPSDAAGTGLYDVAASAWSPALVDAIGFPRAWLPRIIPSGSVAGRITPGAAQRIGVRPGVPVVIAGGDAAAGAVGGGATRPGDALVLLSSGAQVILPDVAFAPDPAGRWYTWPSAMAGHGAPYLRLGTLLNAGNAMAWADAHLAGAGALPSGPTSLIALPHLLGERPPLGEGASRGAILGLTAETTSTDIRQAMLEGVAYGLRHSLEAMTAHGRRPGRIRLGGGGARHPRWPQVIADVLGMPVEPLAVADLSVLGAAMLADASLKPASSGAVITPRAGPAAAYDISYGLYREAIAALAPIHAQVTALGQEPPCP